MKTPNTNTSKNLSSDLNLIKQVANSWIGEYDQLNERHHDLIDRQAALAKEHGGADAKHSDIIKLDVRGHVLFARRDTLTSVKGSRLEALLSGRWENRLLRNSKGAVCMDVDIDIFKKILEYLYMVKISGDEVPPLPSVSKTQEVEFNAQVNYFVLRDVKSKSVDTGQSVDRPSSADQEQKQKQELISSMKRELDEMEHKMRAEESFVACFTNNGEAAPFANKTGSEPSKETYGSNVPLSSVFTHFYVNGEILTYKKSTLCADPTSKLAKDLSDDAWLDEHRVQTEDGKVCILIEQPTYAFRALAKYLHLRSIWEEGSKDAPKPIFEGDQSKHDYFFRMVNHYFLDTSDIGQALCALEMDSDVITDVFHVDKIVKWIGGAEFAPKLLYRASRDGWDAKDFHRLCDGKGATLVAVRSTDGYVFGGYTGDFSWSSCSSSKSSPKAFLYSLSSPAGLGPVKIPCSVVNNDASYGPLFGSGDFDLCICPNANNDNYSYSSISFSSSNTTYPHFLNGTRKFQVDEYEVFHDNSFAKTFCTHRNDAFCFGSSSSSAAATAYWTPSPPILKPPTGDGPFTTIFGEKRRIIRGRRIAREHARAWQRITKIDLPK